MAVLLPAVPIVVGIVITSGSVRAAPANANRYTAVAPTPPKPPGSTGLPSGVGSLVGLLVHGTIMRTAPGGQPLARLSTRTGFGSPQVLSVVRQSSDWLGVISSDAGNGRIGWIPQSSVSLTRVGWQLSVSLAARRLTVLDNGKVLRRYTVAVGRPDAPTPTGHFSVTDRLATHDPSGPYGCCILALSARSPHAIQGWSGGDRIAIHSTPEESSIGQPVSHGCLRLTLAEGRWLMSHIPLGTPTIISA